MRYLSNRQLFDDISSLPELTTLLHYVTFCIQTSLEKKESNLHQQIQIEQFVDYCSQIWNHFNPSESVRTDELMNRLIVMWQMDVRHDQKLALWRAKEGGID